MQAAAAAAGGSDGDGGGGGDDDDEYDPLEAYMAEVNREVAANKPTHNKPKPDKDLGLDEAADPVAEYMQVGGVGGWEVWDGWEVGS